MGPSSSISKILLTLLIILIAFYVYLDLHLYLRIQNYPIDRGIHYNITYSHNPVNYSDVTWINCHINPICVITVKGLFLDQTNQYLFAPLATLADDFTGISRGDLITPNMISFFHVFIAILAGKFVANDNLSMRRLGVVLFQIRTFLDDLDGHVARAKKNIKGERSEVGTVGYYVDGLCDGLGCIALMIGVFVFLKNNVSN